MSYLKPQTPIELGGNYIYPLTTADQVIIDNGNRLNSLFKKTIQETVVLKAYNWSESAPYTQTITLTEYVEDYKIDANVMYTGNENDSALNKAAGCLSYIKKNRKEITFYCLKNKPEIDIPMEITGTCRNTIATVENGIKLNFDIVAYSSEAEMLADTPLKNTIGVITNTPITGYRFNGNEPEDMNDGEVWIAIGVSNAKFEIIDGVPVSPIYAKQMISGALVDVIARSWQGGKWIEWVHALFYHGDQQNDITGGWTSNGYSDGYGSYYERNAEIGETITVATVNGNEVSFAGTQNLVDVSGYKTLSVNVLSCSGSLLYVVIDKSKSATHGSGAVSQTITKPGNIDIDISGLQTDGYYIMLVAWGKAADPAQHITVDKIVMN